MASNTRKKVFPKPPVRFHSKLEVELGKWSNKNGYEASVKAIYNQESKPKTELTEAQKLAVKKLEEAKAKKLGA